MTISIRSQATEACPTCGHQHQFAMKRFASAAKVRWAERTRQAAAQTGRFVAAVSPNGREVRLFTIRRHAVSYCKARGWLSEPCVHVVYVNTTGKPRGGWRTK